MPRNQYRRVTNLDDGVHYTSKFNQEQLEENKKSNTKLDSLTTANHTDLVSLHTQQDGIIGAINNTTLGDGTLGQRTFVYAHDTVNGQAKALKCDAAGRLECSVDALEVTAETINLNTDTMEAKILAISDGQTQNGNGTGNKPGVMLDAINSNTITGNGKLDTLETSNQLIVSSINSRMAVVATSNDNIASAQTQDGVGGGNKPGVMLDAINSNTITGNGKLDTIITNTAAASSAGTATAAHQLTQNNHLSEIEGAVENVELTVGTNTATAPTRSLAIGGKYVDGTFRDIKVDNIGKVIVDSPSGSDINLNLVAISNGQTQNGNGTGNKPGVMLDAINSNTITGNGKLDAQQSTLDSILASSQIISEDFTVCNTGAVVISGSALPSGAATQATLADAEAHLGNIDTGVDVLEACVGSNKVNVNIASNAVDFATQTTLAAAEAHLGNIDTGVDVLEACVGSNKVNVNIASNAVDFATQTTLAAAEAHLGNIDTGVDVLEACVGSNKVNVNIASNAVDFATQTTLAAAEAHLGNIETGVQLIDDAVVVDDAAVTLGSQKGMAIMGFAGTQSVDANDACMLACSTAGRLEVDVKNSVSTAVTHDGLTAIDNAIGTDGSTGPSKCVSIGGTNPLSGNIQEIAVDSAGHLSVDILTSALPTGAAGEISNAATASAAANILTKTTLATSAEIKELLSGATVNQATLSAELDFEHYEKIRLFGETSGAVGSDIKLFGSNTSGGTYFFLNNSDLQAQSLTVSGLGTVHYVGATLENVPRYIKVFNNSGSTNHTFTKLYMVGSGGRVAV